MENENKNEILKESGEFYKILTESISDRLYMLDRNRCVTFVNSSASKASKISKAENVCIDVSLIFPKHTSDTIKNMVDSSFEKGIPSFSEVSDHIEGSDVWNEIRISPVKDVAGNVESVILTIHDITKRKTAENALSERESLYRTLTESLNESIYIIDENRCVKFVNSAASKESKVSKSENVCIEISLIFPQKTANFLKENVDRVFRTGEPIVNELQDDSQNPSKWLEAKLSPIKNDHGKTTDVIVILNDITARKSAEESLVINEKKYRNLVENSLIGIYKTNMNGDILFANNALVNMFGFKSFEELKAGGIKKLYNDIDDRKRLIEELKIGGNVTNFEVVYKKGDGTLINVILSATLDSDELSGMMMDITEKKLGSERLKKLNDELQSKLIELEKFNKVAIGRELKMVELKKRISELEKGVKK